MNHAVYFVPFLLIFVWITSIAMIFMFWKKVEAKTKARKIRRRHPKHVFLPPRIFCELHAKSLVRAGRPALIDRRYCEICNFKKISLTLVSDQD